MEGHSRSTDWISGSMIKVEGKRKIGKVRLYALSTCIWCRKTKALLDRSGVEYEYVYVDELDLGERDEVKEEVRELTGKVSFPTVLINDSVIVGFDEPKLKKELGS
jgi:glutaredoxin-like protein NrdH